MRIQKKLDAENKIYWAADTGEEFAVVAGAIGWAGQKPGFFICAGVSAFENTDIEAYPIQIIAEAGEPDAVELCKIALQFIGRFDLERIYAAPNKVMEGFLAGFNRERAARSLRPIRTAEPHLPDSKLISGLQRIRSLVNPRRKRLSFGPDSVVPGYLLSLDAEGSNTGKLEDHPVISALTSVLSVLTAWKPREAEREIKAILDFDPLDPFSGRPFRPTVETEFDPFAILEGK